MEIDKFKTEVFESKYKEGYRKEALLNILGSVIDEVKALEDFDAYELEKKILGYLNH